jgi:hypothetical protein
MRGAVSSAPIAFATAVTISMMNRARLSGEPP